MDSLLALGLCCIVVACDPVRTGGISLSPRPDVLADSAREQAFALAARLAERRGLAPEWQPRAAGWRQCFVGSLSLCGKATDRGVDFRLSQFGRFSGWSAGADSV